MGKSRQAEMVGGGILGDRNSPGKGGKGVEVGQGKVYLLEQRA